MHNTKTVREAINDAFDELFYLRDLLFNACSKIELVLNEVDLSEDTEERLTNHLKLLQLAYGSVDELDCYIS